jgi:uncharacterized protein YndB with AHSA1/START domain
MFILKGFALMTAFKDSIERELTLPVPIERAWTAITDPAEIRQWFGNNTEFELREGGEGVFKWDENAHRMRIVALEPPRRYVYRWVVSQDDDQSVPFEEMPTTQVEYLLESVPEGTRLKLTETGFASLPADQREGYFGDNSQGWTSELAKLVEYTKTLVAAV